MKLKTPPSDTEFLTVNYTHTLLYPLKNFLEKCFLGTTSYSALLENYSHGNMQLTRLTDSIQFKTNVYRTPSRSFRINFQITISVI
jgi:hypothetical protein